jgi:hypothetical protein
MPEAMGPTSTIHNGLVYQALNRGNNRADVFGRSKDMQRMPPSTEPLSRKFLDKTFCWILADEKERQRRNDRRCERTTTKGRAMAEARTLSFALGDLPSANIAR